MSKTRRVRSISSVWNQFAREPKGMAATPRTLLLRVRNRNDRSAWEQFDVIYRSLLRRYVAPWGFPHDEIEEIVQELMSRLVSHMQSFNYDEAKSFKSYLRTMARNFCSNRLRDRHEQIARTGAFELPQARELEPEPSFDNVWRKEHLRFCLVELRSEFGARDMDAFERLVLEERPVKEVADFFEKMPADVYRLKSDVLKKLRERMLANFGEEV